MKAALIDGYGGSDRCRIADVPRPEPGAGELLIRVRATSVNPVDWKIRRGGLRWVKPVRFPYVLGLDVAGEVAAIGPEVTRFEPGDPVYTFLSVRRGGACAEYAVAPEKAVAEKPAGLSFEEAAAVPLAGSTALQALRDKGELRSGEQLLVNGAAGGVGHFAVQLGAALGALVTGVSGAESQELVRLLGAERTIDYHEDDFTGEEAIYDVICDAVGNQSFRDCAPLLSAKGVYVTTTVGPGVAAWVAATALGGLVAYGRRARLVIVEPRAADLTFLARLIDGGRLRPVVESVFPLAEIGRAHEASESGHTHGKIVVRID